MDNCIFCKIANGEIPSNTVYENEEFRVILDLAPANQGHCLVIPKKHAANIFELDEKTTAKAFTVAKTTAVAIKNALNCEGINILQNNGESAGQTVNHFHIHVIPRIKNDNDRVCIYSKPIECSDEQFLEIKEKIAAKY